jgi:transposase-like protein
LPRRYPVAFRRKVLDLIEAGKSVAEIADQLGVSDQTIYTPVPPPHRASSPTAATTPTPRPKMHTPSRQPYAQPHQTRLLTPS